MVRILNITWSEHVTNYEVRRRTGQPRWKEICANSILVSRQGSERHKTEQLGGQSLEQLQYVTDKLQLMTMDARLQQQALGSRKVY